jgi:hypothetical protein
MGRLDVTATDARAQIGRGLEQPGMLGLRFALHTPLLERPFVSGELDWVFEAAEKAGIPIMVLVPHHLMPAMPAWRSVKGSRCSPRKSRG